MTAPPVVHVTPARPGSHPVAEQLRLALAEQALGDRGRIGHRGGQGLLDGGVDLVAHLGPDGLDVHAEVGQPGGLAVDRVALAPGLDLLLGHVLHVVVGGVAVHAHGHRLDERRPAAGHRLGPRAAGDLEHLLDVVAVGGHALEAVAGGALDGVDGELLVQRRRVGVLVVLQHEDHGQLLDAGPVHRLVEVAARCGAVAEPGDGAARLAAELEGHRHPRGHEHHVGEHRDHPDAAQAGVAEVDVAVAAAGDAGGAAHVLGEDPRGCDPADEMPAQVAVQDAQPVLGGHGPGGADRHRLLAVAVVERPGHLALPVQRHRALLHGAHEEHVAQEPDTVRFVERDRVVGGVGYRRLRDLRSQVRPPSIGGRRGISVRPLPCRGGIATLARRKGT